MNVGGHLTDVAGVRVGHSARTSRGWRTGTTVVLLPPGATAGVDVRGGGPGTRETDLLSPLATIDTAHAICLTGGSAYGLAAAQAQTQVSLPQFTLPLGQQVPFEHVSLVVQQSSPQGVSPFWWRLDDGAWQHVGEDTNAEMTSFFGVSNVIAWTRLCVASGLGASGLGAIVNNSRGIIFAHERKEYKDPFGPSRWQEAVEAATRMRASLTSTMAGAGAPRRATPVSAGQSAPALNTRSPTT